MEILYGILLFLALIVYFMPAIIAWLRKSDKKVLILAINLLAGWTVIGWVIILIWSGKGKSKEKDKDKDK